MEWQRQRSERTLTPPLRCYWQGTELAWQAFRAQMTLTVAQMTHPRPDARAWGGQPRGDSTRSGGADPMTLCLSPDVRWLSPRRGGATRRESLRYCGSPDGTVGAP